MSLTLLLAVTAAVAASMGYFAARKHGDEGPIGDERDERDERDDEKKDEKGEQKREEKQGDAPPEPSKGAKKTKPDPAPFATLPLALGDVVSAGMEERWLAGAVVAREDSHVIAALFLAPEGKEQKAVAAFAPPRKDVWWMSPAELVTPDEPPATIELNGIALQRKARLPVRLSRHGQGAPQVAEEGIWAVYDRGRDVAVVIASQGQAHAWVGTRLEEDDYDRLGGGGDD
ncbi:MAG: hypothetical protein QM820_11635 [Minicystis sp.]